MSSVKTNNTSLPLLWAVHPGIAFISFFRRVECISWVSSARPFLISILQYSFLKSESLKTVVCGCPYLEFCISTMRSARTILWACDWLFNSDELSFSCSRARLYCAARHLAWYFAPTATMSAVLSFDMRRNSLHLWATDQTPQSIPIVHAILRSPSLADSSQKKQTGRFMLSGNILERVLLLLLWPWLSAGIFLFISAPVSSYWTHRDTIYATLQNHSSKWKQFHFPRLDIPSKLLNVTLPPYKMTLRLAQKLRIKHQSCVVSKAGHVGFSDVSSWQIIHFNQSKFDVATWFLRLHVNPFRSNRPVSLYMIGMIFFSNCTDRVAWTKFWVKTKRKWKKSTCRKIANSGQYLNNSFPRKLLA